MRQRASTAYVLLALTALFWAGNWVLARGVQGHMSPIAMAFWRWTGALAILLPFVAGPLAREWPALRRAWKILALLGLLGVGLFNSLSYTGLKYTSATNGVLLNSVIPILIIAINVVVLREPLRLRQGLGVAMSLAGVVAIVARGSLDTLLHLELNRGDLWVLAGITTWAIYTICLRWRPRELSSRAFTGGVIVFGLIFLVPIFAWDYAAGSRTQWSAVTYASVAYWAVFPSVLAYFFWNAGVARVGAERAGAFLHLMPIFGAILAWAFLGESLEVYHYAGAALIFAGLFIATHGGHARSA